MVARAFGDSIDDDDDDDTPHGVPVDDAMDTKRGLPPSSAKARKNSNDC